MTLVDRLAEALGPAGLAPQEQLADYAVDGRVPEAVVFPSTVEDVSRIIELASEEDLAITPWGGGTQMGLGNPPRRLNIVLGMARVNQVVEYSAPDFTVAVGAGYTLASVQEYLAREGQQMPLDAPLPDRATIGGILAANTTGPRRFLYNLPRDWLLGIKVAQADGTVTRSGGRVMKNATGFDLNKLYIGSLGTLGVVVEATFRLLPLPRAEEALVATYDDAYAALGAAQRVASQNFTAQSVEVVSGEARRAMPSGLRGADAGAVLLVSLSGWPGAVARMVDESNKLLSEAKGVEGVSGRECAALCQAVTDLGWDSADKPYASLKVSLLPSRLSEALAALDSVPRQGFRLGMVVGPGYGGLRLLLWADGEPTHLAKEARSYIASAQREVGRLGGHLVVERCPAAVKEGLDVWGEVPGGADVMRRIKAELDPKGMFNPGRFVEGI